jgi:hypothetical protein
MWWWIGLWTALVLGALIAHGLLLWRLARQGLRLAGQLGETATALSATALTAAALPAAEKTLAQSVD